MNLQEMQEKHAQAKAAETHYSELIIEYVENSVFNGKELLDLIKSKAEDPGFEQDPYKMFAGILMEAVKIREANGNERQQI